MFFCSDYLLNMYLNNLQPYTSVITQYGKKVNNLIKIETSTKVK